MENYSKGEVREIEMTSVFVLDDAAVEMKVNANSKIRNLLGYSMKKIKVKISFHLFPIIEEKTGQFMQITRF